MAITLVPISTGTDLVSVSRCAQVAALSSLNSSNPTLLASLISAASDAIKLWLNRDIVLTDYIEYADGAMTPPQELILKQYPVVSVARVSASPSVVLAITNTSTSVQRATVAATGTGLTLVSVASGVTTTSTVTFASNVTMAAVATAVNALGSGWSATATPGYTLHPSADLVYPQGAASAKIGAGVELLMYTEDLPLVGGSGLWPGGYAAGATYGWQLDADAGMIYGAWPAGQRAAEVRYSAGYQEVPGPIQEACVQYILDLNGALTVNQNLASTRLGDYSESRFDPANAPALSPKVRGLLAPYKAHSRVY